MTAEVKEVFKRLQKSPGVSGVRIVMINDDNDDNDNDDDDAR